MLPAYGSRQGRPCFVPHHRCHNHHHHHHHHHLLCPLNKLHHHHCLSGCHRHLCPNFASFPQNPQPRASHAFSPNFNKEAHDSAPQALQDQENGELEEEDEPVFVLTDEWRNFFAESEAKRKLAKKQAKKGKK
ncbi:hypothetical protein UlMin_031904 [Ulmus minor]